MFCRPDISTPDEIRSHSPSDPTRMFGVQTVDTASVVSSDSQSTNPDVSSASIPRSTHIRSDAGSATPTGDQQAKSSPKKEKKTKSGHSSSKKHKSGSKKTRDPAS